MRSRYPVRRVAIIMVFLVSFCLAGDPARADPPADIFIPAQPLPTAITRLAEQSRISIYGRSELLEGKTSSPVEGALSPQAALEAMLKGTGLEAGISHSGTFIVKARQEEVPAAPVRNAVGEAAETPVSARLEEDVIVVTGSYTRGLGQAIDIKHKNDTISDAIVAADIGKLPAVNIAEALQRMPGITISREAGEGQFIGVRGLGPNFQSVTFNGVPIAFNENIRNSDQSGRQFRFRVLPADLIGGVVVTKSPTADLLDGGIGANIDIVTVRPLDRGNFATARVFGSIDERADKPMPNGSLSIGRTTRDETLGVIGSLSFQQREVQFDRFQTFGYEVFDIGDQEDVQVPAGWNTTVEEEKRRRLSFLGALQWHPSETINVHSEILYSNFNNVIAENRISYEFGDLVTDYLVEGSARIKDGVLHAGAIEGGVINRNGEYSEQTHENLSVTTRADLEIGDWSVSPTLSFSQARSNLDVPLQRIDGRLTAPEGIIYYFDLGADPVREGGIDTLSTNLDLTDPGAVPFRRYRIRPIHSLDQDNTGLLDARRQVDLKVAGITIKEVKIGAQYTERLRDYQRRDRMVTIREGYQVDESYYTYAIPESAFDGIINARNLWTGPDFSAFRNAFDVPGDHDGVSPQTDDLHPTSNDLSQSYRIEEAIAALYGRIGFETQVRTIPVSGNIGARWVDTATTVFGTALKAQGNSSAGMETISVPRVTEGTYREFLPSLNLKMELSDDLVLRLGASRSMTRPSLASLRDATVPSSATVSEIFELGEEALEDPNLDVNAVGGNPALDPYVSANYDISLEQYFQDFGAATVSVFHKQIDDFISGDTRRETWPFAVNDGRTLPVDILVNRPRNIGTASISGLELGYTNHFENGFGLSASATFTESEIDLELQDGSGQSARLQGVSDFSYSITPFYDRGPVEAHVSYTWRSAFDSNGNVTIASDVHTDIQDTVIATAFGTLDFGATYHLDERFDIFAEGVNMADARQAAYQGQKTRPYQIQQYGRTLNIGLRFNF